MLPFLLEVVLTQRAKTNSPTFKEHHSGNALARNIYFLPIRLRDTVSPTMKRGFVVFWNPSWRVLTKGGEEGPC